MYKQQRGFTIIEVVVVALILVGGLGWMWNIVKLSAMCCDISGMLVLRAIGIFLPPLGAILGFL
jgi:prepilin-type N-terminal cleavage/methylation domain-containing protein